MIGNKKRNFITLDEYEDLNTLENYKKFLEEKNKWFKKIDGLQDGESLEKLFDSITIPLFCSYTSTVFNNHSNHKTQDFIDEYENEIKKLQERLNKGIKLIKDKYKDSGEPISTNLNIVLMLFPIPDKKELVKKLHTKLYHQQKS